MRLAFPNQTSLFSQYRTIALSIGRRFLNAASTSTSTSILKYSVEGYGARRKQDMSSASGAPKPVNVPEVKRVFRETLERAKRRALEGGGEARLARQHARGKLSARERLEVLLDEGSFREYDILKTHRCTDFGMEKDLVPGDGVVGGRTAESSARG